MNSSALPEIAESLEEIDRMPPRLLVIPVDGVREALLGRVILVMARRLLQILPGRLLRVLLGRVLREADHAHPRVPLEPLLDLGVGQVGRRVEPQQDRATRYGGQQQLEPGGRGPGVLKVDREGRDFLARAQVFGPVDVLGKLRARAVGDARLPTDRIPPLADRPLEVDSCLVPRQRRHSLAVGCEFGENEMGFGLEAGLLLFGALDVESPAALPAPSHQVQDLAHSALAIHDTKALVHQIDDGAKRPPAAHLRARHGFFAEQRTEPGKVLGRKPTLPVLPTPARVVLQARKAALLVGVHPARDRTGVNEQDVSDLLVGVTFVDEHQGVVARTLARMRAPLLVQAPRLEVIGARNLHRTSFGSDIIERVTSIPARLHSYCSARHLGVPVI
jgi:hypothetical protein